MMLLSEAPETKRLSIPTCAVTELRIEQLQFYVSALLKYAIEESNKRRQCSRIIALLLLNYATKTKGRLYTENNGCALITPQPLVLKCIVNLPSAITHGAVDVINLWV